MIENALIKRAEIEKGDYGWQVYIELAGAGWGICAGAAWALAKRTDLSSELLSSFVIGIMDTIGVEKWSDLPGKYCRTDEVRAGGIVERIGHITDNKWFKFREACLKYDKN